MTEHPKTLHFISGLPRSGSTLLSSLLRQNPKITAGMTSPVGHLFNAMLGAASMRGETGVFLEDDHRKRLLRACFESYYADVPEDGIVFDTNRMWTTKMHILQHLYPQAKVIACVRNPAWIVDSVESLVRRNVYDLSGIFNFEPSSTVYSRAEGLTAGNGMLGFAINALREAVYGAQADRLMLVRYDTLVADPLGTLREIHAFCGIEMGAYDPNTIEPNYDMIEFDRRLGTPGLHDVGRKVMPRGRKTILPPDIYHRHAAGAFWENAEEMPEGVRVL